MTGSRGQGWQSKHLVDTRSPLPSNQTGQINNASGQILIGVTCMLLVLCVVAVGGRVCARRMAKIHLEADDHLAVVALILFIALSIEQFLLAHYLIVIARTHSPERSTLQNLAKVELASQFTYNFLLTCARASILFLYRRIFTLGNPYFRAIWIVSATLVLGYCAALLAGTIQQCGSLPLDTLWRDPKSCNYSPTGAISMGFLNASVDFELLLLPMPMVCGLQMSAKRKGEVCGLFGLGIIGVAVSIARAVTLTRANPFQDGATDFVIWSTTEPAVVLLCACLPSLRSLFISAFERLSSPHSVSRPSDASTGRFARLGAATDEEMRILPSNPVNL